MVGARIIGGLVPCNVIADEILTDHPARYRAMLVESANPAHSLAESGRMREALGALELLVVIDVAMTETARLADYVLPAPSQYEKWEATFFNFESPANIFHLRRPLLPAPDGRLPEPEIHARLVEALGELTESDLAPLRDAATRGRGEFAAAFFEATSSNPKLGTLAPIVLYRTLGPTLPDGAAAAAILWGASHRCAQSFPDALRRAGFTGDGLEPGSGCSTPSSPVPPGSSSASTSRPTAGDGCAPSTAGCTSTSRSCWPSWRRWPSRRSSTRSIRSCSPPASGGRSPPTPSSATRHGASVTRAGPSA